MNCACTCPIGGSNTPLHNWPPRSVRASAEHSLAPSCTSSWHMHAGVMSYLQRDHAYNNSCSVASTSGTQLARHIECGATTPLQSVLRSLTWRAPSGLQLAKAECCTVLIAR
jgi:hypothetical protein